MAPIEWQIAPAPDAQSYDTAGFPVQLYQGNIINFGGNWTFPDLSLLPRGLSIEVPVVKPWNGRDIQQTIDLAYRTIELVAERGNTVTRFTMDEPFTGGIMAGIGALEVINFTQQWIDAMPPEIELILIEAVPQWQPEHVNGFMAHLTGLHGLHLDVDHNRAVKEGFSAQRLLEIEGVTGLIMWGWNEGSERTFVEAAKAQFKWFNTVYNGRWPKTFISQSWMWGLPTRRLVELLGYARNRIL